MGSIEANCAAASATQKLLEELGVLGGRIVLHHDDGGYFKGSGVELLDELSNDLAGLAILGSLHEEVIAANHLPTPDEEHLHPGLVGSDGDGNGVEIRGTAGIYLDGTLLLELLNGAHLITERGGALEFQLLGGGLHLVTQLARDGFGVALQKQDHLLDNLGVLFLAGQAGAGSDAAVNVILEAGPRIGPRNPLGAGAVGEQLLDQVHGLADAAGAGEWPEVTGAILVDPSRDVHPGKILGQVHLQVGIGLIVLETDVEVGPVALDERVLKDERLGLGVRDDILEVGQFADHASGLAIQASRGSEVGTQAIPQDRGLADVYHPASGVLHQVDAGAFRRHQQAMVEFLPNHDPIPASCGGAKVRRKLRRALPPTRRKRCRSA